MTAGGIVSGATFRLPLAGEAPASSASRSREGAVSIRQHTSAYVSIRQLIFRLPLFSWGPRVSASRSREGALSAGGGALTCHARALKASC
jgi:hypothetical protein